MRVTFLILAAVVPLAALWFAAPVERAAQGLAVRPFGWPSLVVVHALCAVPAAWLLARALRRPYTETSSAVLAGVLMAVIWHFMADMFGEWVAVGELDFVARAAVRSGMGVLLASPWCLAAVGTAPAPGYRPDPLAALAVVVIAVGLPAVHANRLAEQAMAEAEARFQQSRPARAAPLLEVAADLAPGRTFADRETVVRKRAKLVGLLTELAKQADRPAAKPTVQRALVLLALDRLADAEDVLRPLADRDPLARLYLGECEQWQGRWADGDADLRAALAGLLPRSANRETADDCRKAFDQLAESATKRNRPAEREAVLREALEQLPAQAGYWHLQLGRHFQLSGRPFDALEEFDAAEKTDGKLKPELDALRHHIREHTPGCLVR